MADSWTVTAMAPVETTIRLVGPWTITRARAMVALASRTPVPVSPTVAPAIPILTVHIMAACARSNAGVSFIEFKPQNHRLAGWSLL